MGKLNREEVKQRVEKIRAGMGEDDEVNLWIRQIEESVPNQEVIKAIMIGPNATIEDVLERLYTNNVITL